MGLVISDGYDEIIAVVFKRILHAICIVAEPVCERSNDGIIYTFGTVPSLKAHGLIVEHETAVAFVNVWWWIPFGLQWRVICIVPRNRFSS
jgi:hypothetical protein